MTSHRENRPEDRSWSPAGRPRRPRARARVDLERLEPRLLLSGTADSLEESVIIDRPPTRAWIDSEPPRGLIGLDPLLSSASRNIESSVRAVESSYLDGQAVPD